MPKTVKRQSLLHGATILVAATGLVKVLGGLFRIPLQNIIGSTGISYYDTAYALYLPIYSLAMAGLPIALSRLVSESVARGSYRDVRAYRRVAQRMFLASGLVGTFVLFLIAYPFASFVNSGALLSILLTAPSLLFCCAMASYRGYYEGLRNMYPTAISSVIEALGKLVIGLVGAYIVVEIGMSEFRKAGTVFGAQVEAMDGAALEEVAYMMTLPYGAAAAIAGVTLGTLLGAIYLVLRKRMGGDGITREMLLASPPARSRRYYLRSLVSISIPIVIGSLAQNIAGLVDVTQVQRQLLSVVHNNTDLILNMYAGRLPAAADLDKVAQFLYGCYKGIAFSIYNLVPTLTAALGISALPALAAAWTKRDRKAIRSNLESVLRVSALFVLPAGLGIFSMARPIMNLLLRDAGAASISAPILGILGITAIFSGMTMPLTNMLQAIGKQKIPVRNMAIGVVLKVGVNFVLVGIPSINIMGAPVGTLVCYLFLFVMNLIALLRHSRVRPDFVSVLLKPLTAALMCALAAWVSYRPLLGLLGGKLAAVCGIFCGAAVYLLALVLLRAIRKEDILTLPKGEKIAAKLERWRIIS